VARAKVNTASVLTTNGGSVSYGTKLPPIHPGEILLEEFLKPLGMSMNKVAEELHVPANRITCKKWNFV
jgi:hypothetical protein